MKTLFVSKGSLPCTRARTWLALHQIEVEVQEVETRPPSVEQLQLALGDGKATDLLETNGAVYQQLGLGDLLQHLGSKEILEMISAEGALLQTPLLIDETTNLALIGFRESEWKAALT